MKAETARPKPLYSYNMPIVGWLFMILWIGMLVMFTFLFVRDGGFHQFDPLLETGIMLLFWMFGLAGLGHAMAQPRSFVFEDGDELVVTQKWLLRRQIERFSKQAIQPPVLQTQSDSDGDTYTGCICTPSGHKVIFIQGNDKTEVAAAFAEFARRLGQG